MSFANRVKNLREAINQYGMRGFVEVLMPKLLDAKEGEKPVMTPEDFSLKEIYEACLKDDDGYYGSMFEAVNVSQFTVIVGELISRKIMAGYNEYAGVADQLVDKFTSNLQTDNIPGGYIKSNIETVPAGHEYPHSADIAEKYVTIGHEKRGEILDITEEAVKFDQTGIVMRLASRYGKEMAKDREKSIMYTIQDATVDGVNFYAWYPSGTRVALYYATDRTSAYVPGTIYANQVTDALADYSDLEAAEALFADMYDENGDPIDMGVDDMVLLVPRALRFTARRIINNDYIPANSGSSVGYHERNPFAGLKHVVSPWIDKVSANDWYFGNFKAQFVEKIVIPIQVQQRGRDSEDGWRRDIITSYKIRRMSKVGATDYRHVVKSTGGS